MFETESFFSRPQEYYPKHRPYNVIERWQYQDYLEVDGSAMNLFKQWGLTDNHVAELSMITSTFRYDLCVSRVQKLASQGVYLYAENPDIPFQILFPIDESEKDTVYGDCGVLTAKFLAEVSKSSWITNVNAFLSKNGMVTLDMIYTWGYSDKFFTIKDSKHVWAALQQRSENFNIDQAVLIDPSLQRITAHSSSGYKPGEAYFKNSTKYNIGPNLTSIGTYIPFHDVNEFTTHVIGYSTDRTAIVSIGFVRDISVPMPFHTEKIYPLIN